MIAPTIISLLALATPDVAHGRAMLARHDAGIHLPTRPLHGVRRALQAGELPPRSSPAVDPTCRSCPTSSPPMDAT